MGAHAVNGWRGMAPGPHPHSYATGRMGTYTNSVISEMLVTKIIKLGEHFVSLD